jgi:hypothetical protein
MTNKSPSNERRAWSKPRTECLESRAEISAYVGTARPWQNR